MHRIWATIFRDNHSDLRPGISRRAAPAAGWNWVLVQNPNNSDADIQLTYMTTSGPVAGPCAQPAPYSRKSFKRRRYLVGQWAV